MAGFDHESIDSLKLITTLLFFFLVFIYKQTDILDPAYIYIHSIQIDTYRWIHTYIDYIDRIWDVTING